MSVKVRTTTPQNVAAGAAITSTYSEGTPLNNSHGHIYRLRSQAGSGVDPTPATPAGWTLVGSAVATASGFTVNYSIFAKRGDGTTNSITIAGTTGTARSGILAAIDGVTTDVFWENWVASQSNSPGTSRSIALPAGTKANSVNFYGVGLSSTAGGSGFSWNQGTADFTGTSPSSIHSAGFENLPIPEANTYTATWTTNGISAGGGATFGGSSSAPIADAELTNNLCLVDCRGSYGEGTVTYDLTPTTNIVDEPIPGYYLVQETNAAQFLTLTITAGGETDTLDVTVPAVTSSEALELVVKQGGVWV